MTKDVNELCLYEAYRDLMNTVTIQAAQIRSLEAQADWLAEHGAGIDQCPFLELQYGDAEPVPDWCEGSETIDDGFECSRDPVECWRKVAQEKTAGQCRP